MAISFPENPTSGDIYTVNGRSWQWDGSTWGSYGTFADPASFKVDAVNDRVGVNLGSATPSYTLDVSGDARVSSDFIVGGDLTVSGTTVTLDSQNLLVEDNIITLNSNVTGTPSLDAGIEVERGDETNAQLLWDESAGAWVINSDFTVDTDTLHVDSVNDRVGIGTTNPARPLEVDGGSVGIAATFKSTNATGGISLMGSGTTDDTRVRIGAEGDDLKLFSNNIERVRIDSSGKVGIGTTTPDSLLEIKSSRSELKISSSEGDPLTNHSGRILFENTNISDTYDAAAIEIHGGTDAARNGSITFLTNPNGTSTPNGLLERMIINELGNVGINDTTPSYTLDVNGDINTQSDLLVNGTSVGRGLLGYLRTATDFSLSTTVIDVGSVTFTLDSNRFLLIGMHLPLIDARSTSNIVTANVNSGAGRTGSTYLYSVNQVSPASLPITMNGWRVTQFPAGTYTVYLNAGTNTGTARINGAGSGGRYTGLFVLDVGGY